LDTSDNQFTLRFEYRSTTPATEDGSIADVWTTPVGVVPGDGVAPTVSAAGGDGRLDGDGGWFLGSTSVGLWAVDDVDEVPVVEYSLDGGESWLAYGAAVGFAQQGVQELWYRARDAADNVAQGVFEVKIDSVAPVVSLSGGPDGEVFEGRVVAPECVAVDGVPGSGVASCVLEGFSTQVGTHTVVGVARDYAGNRSVSEPVTYTVVASQDVDVDVLVGSRCVSGKAFLTVQVANKDVVGASVEVLSVFGSKVFASVAAGKTASHAFTTRVAQVGQGTLTVHGTELQPDGEPRTIHTTISYGPMPTCG
jgi:hypothetical protein